MQISWWVRWHPLEDQEIDFEAQDAEVMNAPDCVYGATVFAMS